MSWNVFWHMVNLNYWICHIFIHDGLESSMVSTVLILVTLKLFAKCSFMSVKGKTRRLLCSGAATKLWGCVP